MKLVLDSDRRPVGTLPLDALTSTASQTHLEIDLTPGARRRIPTDAETIVVPRREIAAIRREGVLLARPLRGLGPR